MLSDEIQNILELINAPVLVAKALCINNKTADFTVEFINSEFEKVCKNHINEGDLLSQVQFNLSQNFSISKTAEDVLTHKKNQNFLIFSDQTLSWYTVDIKLSKDEYIILSLQKYFHQEEKPANHSDILTGLPDRTVFNQEFNRLIFEAEKSGEIFAILLMDLDNLKDTNNTMGYQEGDEIIKKTSRLLKNFEKNNIFTYKTGDDEFTAIIRHGENSDSIINISDTIFEVLSMNQIQISGGLVIYPDHAKTKDDLLHFADITINYAKKEGKNKFTVFDYDLQKVYLQKLILQRHMTNAVLESDFKLYYQPQFNIKTGELRGFEALIRWQDEELGEISPSVFIPIAEQCGLILPIGTWVLNTAFQTLQKWRQQFNFNGVISVNVSPVQLKQPDFLINLTDLIEKYEIDTKNLELEITEGILIDNMEDIISKLSEVKSLGIKISLDDFGTGYSSLNYLQKLPLSTLKIDKSFINDITKQDGVQAKIINSIINMVSTLGLETIAEGVEQNGQLSILEKFECSIVQGFLRGKPMPAENCERFLAGDKSALLTIQD